MLISHIKPIRCQSNTHINNAQSKKRVRARAHAKIHGFVALSTSSHRAKNARTLKYTVLWLSAPARTEQKTRAHAKIHGFVALSTSKHKAKNARAR